MDASFRPLQNPFTALTIGVSGCGKSYYWCQLIEKQAVFAPVPERFIFFTAFDAQQFAGIEAKYPDKTSVHSIEELLSFEPQKNDLIVLDEANLCFSRFGVAFEKKLESWLVHDSHHLSFSVVIICQRVLQTRAFALLHQVQCICFPSASLLIHPLVRHLPLDLGVKRNIQAAIKYLAGTRVFVLFYISANYNHLHLQCGVFSHLEYLPDFCLIHSMSEAAVGNSSGAEAMEEVICNLLPARGITAPNDSYVLIRANQMSSLADAAAGAAFNKDGPINIAQTDHLPDMTSPSSRLEHVDGLVVARIRAVVAPNKVKRTLTLWTFIKEIASLRIDSSGAVLSTPDKQYTTNLYDFLNELLKPAIAYAARSSSSSSANRRRGIDEAMVHLLALCLQNVKFPHYIITNKHVLGLARKRIANGEA